VMKATKARRRVGFATAELREPLSRIFLNEQVDTSPLRHVIDKNIALARAAAGPLAGVDGAAFAPGAYEFPISLSADDERYAEALADQRAARAAILNPGGGWPTKLWPVERFGELADQPYERQGLVAYGTVGPGE